MGLLATLQWLEKTLPNITITVKAKPYLTRAYFLLKDRMFGNLYLHHFRSSDQGTQLHSHPWAWGVSLVLLGGYSEERAIAPATWAMVPAPEKNVFGEPNLIKEIASGIPHPVTIVRREVRPWSFNFIRPTDFHRVDLYDEEKGAWTLFLAGPRIKQWGFLDRNTSEFIDWRKNPEAIA